jgi:hypothetical protein
MRAAVRSDAAWQTMSQPQAVLLGACAGDDIEAEEGRHPPRRRASLVNGTRATAAVMQYGCWRGEVFEGCELRCRDPACPVWPPSGGSSRWTAKGIEPHTRLRDATSPGPMTGGNRRGGANPRGRNVMQRCGSRCPKESVFIDFGSGRSRDRSRERHLKWTKPRRGGCGVSCIPARPGSLRRRGEGCRR